MKFAMLFSALFLLTVAWPESATAQDVRRIDGDPQRGFDYSYYLYIPSGLTDDRGLKKTRSMIVIPNNSGKINDDISFHDEDVKRRITATAPVLAQSGISAPILMPVFPRPATHHTIYTHSLDRDTMLTGKREFRRFDLQLVAMIKDARRRLATERIRIEKKVLMMGYSASGMFVNRFAFIHPKIVKAAIIGAPGGWPLAPVISYREKLLTYPAGVSDLKEVSGNGFDVHRVRKIPFFILLGGEDTNDAVPMGDAYDEREAELVLSLFGKTPVERFPHAERLYKNAGLNAEFKLYPNTSHQMSKEMRDDQIAFIKKHALN